MTISIEFIKGHENPRGTVSGQLKVVEADAGAERYLGELADVHPDFAAHLVKAVNTYAALARVMSAQGAQGPVAAALRDILQKG